jgi:hypothetical protein
LSIEREAKNIDLSAIGNLMSRSKELLISIIAINNKVNTYIIIKEIEDLKIVIQSNNSSNLTQEYINCL